MKIALLGLPQAGKRTLFSVLTGRRAPEHRKEGEAVEGRATIRDARVDVLTRIARPRKTTYAENLYALCPDVVIGGQRDWLEPARRCDLLCWLVRGFVDAAVYHPAGTVDALRDRGDLEAEAILADLELIEKRLERIAKEDRGGKTPARALEEKTLRQISAVLEDGGLARSLDLPPAEAAAIRSLGLLTLKPFLWLVNVGEDDIAAQAAKSDQYSVSCRIEEEIMAIADAAEREEFLSAVGLAAPGVDRVNAAAYEALGLMSFYTIGEDEVRAWTIRRGAPAPTAGGKVHTDIERGFIRAEIIAYDNLVAAGSEAAAKQQGHLQVRGRDYIMQDGDIAHFLFNV